MPFRIRLRPEVETEVLEAMAWYQERPSGVDRDFYRAFRDTLTSLEEAPKRYARVRGEVRRVVFRRFAYLLFYVIEGDEVGCMCISAATQKPGRRAEA
jgi:plasmid stabilization system protein ParE